MIVEELMNRNVKTCSANDTLEVAARIMWENDCGVVPIVDQEGRAVGVVTDRDICMAGYTQGMQYWQIPVAVAASKVVFTVGAKDEIGRAEQIMKARQVRRLPVVDAQGKIVGILSLNDLACHMGHRSGDVQTDEVVDTLCAISKHTHAPMA